ncbi:hypothetical protein R1flu_024523 [Riccia fluitans]|uniref:Uncharacterized protein n=1 Tax=Riccia fluitans TaxID=41844 RepID=A0ABD1XV54_9MARC
MRAGTIVGHLEEDSVQLRNEQYYNQIQRSMMLLTIQLSTACRHSITHSCFCSGTSSRSWSSYQQREKAALCAPDVGELAC